MDLCSTMSAYGGLDPGRILFFIVSLQVSPLLFSIVFVVD